MYDCLNDVVLPAELLTFDETEFNGTPILDPDTGKYTYQILSGDYTAIMDLGTQLIPEICGD